MEHAKPRLLHLNGGDQGPGRHGDLTRSWECSVHRKVAGSLHGPARWREGPRLEEGGREGMP